MASQNDTNDLLIEIGCEELPPKALKTLSAAFMHEVGAGLTNAELKFKDIIPYATPRRLALLVHSLDCSQSEREVTRRGPAVTAAFTDDGLPTQAAIGFARSCGIDVEELEKLENEKGAWLVHTKREPGCATNLLLQDIVTHALSKLPIPKRMRWADLKAEFVRPVHWIVLLFGDAVVNAEILSVQAGRETRGHRFHYPHNLYLGEPAAYAPLLESEGFVIADFAIRREAIRGQILQVAVETGGKAVIDDDLLDEVTSMVEWPVAILGSFDQQFLEVPSEALISAMKNHQKYFHLVDKNQNLMPFFITIANLASKDIKQIRQGNQRVIRPRLADAAFFWQQDCKNPLVSHLPGLKSIVFQHKLGSLYDKVQRISGLAMVIAERLGADVKQAERAAQLCKCDLSSKMVGEFPELQGIMGRYYALHDKEPESVAVALDEQYMPRFAGDGVPKNPIGQAIAISDKIDTLVGIFGIGLVPTGDKDPFGLRRSALGLLRIMIERKLDLDLVELLKLSVDSFAKQIDGKKLVAQVYDFIMERLRAYYLDSGVGSDTFEAVLAQQPEKPYDFDRRVNAVKVFQSFPEAQSLATANKRISNIIRKQANENKIPRQVDESSLQDSAEIELFNHLQRLTDEVTPLFAQKDYDNALKRLAELKEPVDLFFDKVMVMVDDPKIRDNRLAILNMLRKLFLQVADFSKLQS